MDFHSLARKELQALCKKNKIPANMTNLAMADSLAALDHVEGLEDILNETQSQSDQQKFSNEIGSPNAPRTACRTSTKKNPAAREELESSQQPMTRTRRATRRGVEEEATAPPETPAARSTIRRRAGPVSATKKDEIGSVQRAYSTRRSVRFLEKTLESLSLGGDVKIAEVPEECLEKSDGSSAKEVSSEMTQTESTDCAGEEEDSKPKSESADSVEAPDEDMDVEAKALVEKEIETSNNELETSNSNDIPVEVSSGVIDREIETISSNKGSVYVAEPAAELGSENFVNLASEESSEPEEKSFSEASAVESEVSNFQPESDDKSPKEEEEESMESEASSESEESDSNTSLVVDLNEDKFEPNEAVLETSEKESMESEASNESEESDSNTSLVDDLNEDKFEPNEAVLETSSVVPASPLLFAANQLSGQFPRPSLPTPTRSSSKKNRPEIQMITDVLDENEEEDNNEANKDETRSLDNSNNLPTKLYNGTSLRQLQKMLKNKLQIENNKEEKTRIALQKLPENRLAVDEPLK